MYILFKLYEFLIIFKFFIMLDILLGDKIIVFIILLIVFLESKFFVKFLVEILIFKFIVVFL